MAPRALSSHQNVSPILSLAALDFSCPILLGQRDIPECFTGCPPSSDVNELPQCPLETGGLSFAITVDNSRTRDQLHCPETGLEEMNSGFLERDLWPAWLPWLNFRIAR